MKDTKEKAKELIIKTVDYALFAIKWVLLASVTGIVAGLIGTVFLKSLHFVSDLRATQRYLVWFLPIGGVLIALVYRVCKLQKCGGTNLLIRSAENGERVPLLLVPAVFITTVLTHLVGGSMGKEGAALQLGGTIGYNFGRAIKANKSDLKILTLCGMSGLFASLFGTPITAAIFAIEFISIGTIYYSGFLPCIVSSLTAILTARYFGCTYTVFNLANVPKADALTFVKVFGASIVIAITTIVFVLLIHSLEHLAERFLKNPELRGAIGGAILLIMTGIVGNQTYNGAGMETVELIMNGGRIFVLAFAIKMLFTAVSIAAGFKGGEIVPSFFIGAALGYVIAPIFGLDPIFCAAIGLVAFFCGVSNSTIASIVLSVELFGGAGILYFSLACVTAFALSGNHGLYISQKFVFSKIGEKTGSAKS